MGDVMRRRRCFVVCLLCCSPLWAASSDVELAASIAAGGSVPAQSEAVFGDLADLAKENRKGAMALVEGLKGSEDNRTPFLTRLALAIVGFRREENRSALDELRNLMELVRIFGQEPGSDPLASIRREAEKRKTVAFEEESKR
jgi:hypothetical protein